MQPILDTRDGGEPKPDLVCLSHLRWNFVYQRPQHLMSRFARDRRVLFFEEPVFHDGPPRLSTHPTPEGVEVAVPHLPHGTEAGRAEALQAGMLRGLLAAREMRDFVLWYYTPMATAIAQGLEPIAVVYDCMDELSLFRGAPKALIDRERALLAEADLVFTGGPSLYHAKRSQHPAVHCFPSSIDAAHFGRARSFDGEEPADQAGIPRPRLGYFGVLDERIDFDLLDGLAAARPEWQIVMVGPFAKIDPAALPRRDNLHYLGMKDYRELPAYLAGWDVAIAPFARNEATRFISPTKTPEYLAGGRPVVSTPIKDVERPYGELGLVEIAGDPESFVGAAERCLGRDELARAGWLRRVDEHLAGSSWDLTHRRMSDLIEEVMAEAAWAQVSR